MRGALEKIVSRFADPTIVVVGDLIADQFLYGQIARVSREAPVLVLEHTNLLQLPGGAANAANNLLDLGCKVRVVAAVGRDAPGRGLVSALKRKRADIRHVRVQPGYATPVKTRILAGQHHSSPQQIVRVDRVPGEGALPCRRWTELESAFEECAAVVLSDYGFGTVTGELLDSLRPKMAALRIPIVVDSRFAMGRYCGVTSITPNITELEAATGRAIGADASLLRRVGSQVLRKQRLQSLLVTQGKYGMTLFEQGRRPLHIPIYGKDDVADVTGAGDTVIAVFTLALACGASFSEAAHLANYAGGIVVMKRGTATVTREELEAALVQNRPDPATSR